MVVRPLQALLLLALLLASTAPTAVGQECATNYAPSPVSTQYGTIYPEPLIATTPIFNDIIGTLKYTYYGGYPIWAYETLYTSEIYTNFFYMRPSFAQP